MADQSLGIVSGQSLVIVASVASSSGYLYTSTGLFTSGHILATGSITGKSGLISAGTISGSSTLQIVGAGSFVGNVASSGSITAGSSFVIGSADMNEADLEKLDGITNGTAAAGKAVVVDASKDIATLGAVGLGSISGTMGRWNVASGQLNITGTVNSSNVVATILSGSKSRWNLASGILAVTGTVDSTNVVADVISGSLARWNVAAGALVITGSVTATTLTIASVTASSAIMPDDDNTQDLGSPSFRWRNIYTGDLHLANDRGNWTVIEESNFLSLRNNKTGQRFNAYYI